MRFMAGLLGRPLGNVGQPPIGSEWQSHRPGIRAEHRARRMHPDKAFAPVGIGPDLTGLTVKANEFHHDIADL